MQLIDIEPIEKEGWILASGITGIGNGDCTYYVKHFYDIPTVDAALVVHARWIEPVPGDGFPYCSNCKKIALDKGLFLNPKLMGWHMTPYCPHCGAKMDLN